MKFYTHTKKKYEEVKFCLGEKGMFILNKNCFQVKYQAKSCLHVSQERKHQNKEKTFYRDNKKNKFRSPQRK